MSEVASLVGRASARPHTEGVIECCRSSLAHSRKGGLKAAPLVRFACIFAFAATLGCTAQTPMNSSPTVPMNGWKLFAPLPDPVGYAGMFGGVLNGRLLTGGGSQFRDKPNWLQGEKVFSDRIFVLATPDGKWSEHRTRLPRKSGHFASATTEGAIYLAGGIDSAGCQKHVLKIEARGDDLTFTRLPDLPQPLGYGAGMIVGRRFYVVGGLHEPTSKQPGVELLSLDLDAPGADDAGNAWRREPDHPGPGFFVAATASDGENLYVFGGIGFNAEGKPTPAKAAYRFSPTRRAWERLPDLPEPRVGAATPCPLVGGGKFFVIGGYAEVFPGAPRDYPGFRAQTLHYDPASQRWENGPVMPQAPVPNRDSPGDPGPVPVIGAPSVVWKDHVVVISGEARASVRTPAVIAWPLRSGATAK